MIALPERVPLFWRVSVHDAVELREWTAPGLVPESSLHVTLLYIGGRSAMDAAMANELTIEGFQQTFEALQRLDGAEVEFSVTEVLKHSEMILARVELPSDIPCISPCPHLTLCRSPGVAPKLANDVARSPQLCEVIKLQLPVLLRGVVGLETGLAGRPMASEVAEPTAFEGKLLRVETNPRPTRQTEPTAVATFLSGTEGEIQAWAARLAASVKERPAGPASCKLKARVQAAGKPGHLYIKWGATAAGLGAREIAEILEARLQETL